MSTSQSALNNKIALVTGGSRGIGRAISQHLAAKGALVAVHYGFQKEAANETVTAIRDSGGKAFILQAELGTPDDAATLWANFDDALAQYRHHAGDEDSDTGIDILVNNAGQAKNTALEETTKSELEKTFAVNATAPFFITQLGLKRIRDEGRIINISSGVSQVPWTIDMSYAMTKAALDSLTKSLAKKLAPRKITVNSVAPGIVQTDINAAWLANAPEAQRQSAAWSVFNRVGQVDDIADIVGLIATEESHWITGQYIDATGGSLLSGA